MRNNYTDNHIVKDATDEDDKLLLEYYLKGKLHPDFLPMTTYDMVQAGYPLPDHGEMVVRIHGGTDEKDVLQPSHGMWIKREDFIKFLELTNTWHHIRNINTMFVEPEPPIVIEESKKKKIKSKKNDIRKSKKSRS